MSEEQSSPVKGCMDCLTNNPVGGKHYCLPADLRHAGRQSRAYAVKLEQELATMTDERNEWERRANEYSSDLITLRAELEARTRERDTEKSSHEFTVVKWMRERKEMVDELARLRAPVVLTEEENEALLLLAKTRPQVGPWKTADYRDEEQVGKDWGIADFGECGHHNKKVWLTTDRLNASRSNGACPCDDAAFVAGVRNYYGVLDALVRKLLGRTEGA